MREITFSFLLLFIFYCFLYEALYFQEIHGAIRLTLSSLMIQQVDSGGSVGYPFMNSPVTLKFVRWINFSVDTLRKDGERRSRPLTAAGEETGLNLKFSPILQTTHCLSNYPETRLPDQINSMVQRRRADSWHQLAKIEVNLKGPAPRHLFLRLESSGQVKYFKV
jgi:hypothetical protein